MKKSVFILIITFITFGFKKDIDTKKYILISLVEKEIPGFKKKIKLAEINKVDVAKLSEPLKALAAYYSAFAGNNCDKDNCELTSALGLGVQGSDEHKALIKKWFRNDKVANKLIAQNCFQSPNGSSNFSNYRSLVFEVKNNTININFSILNYDHGKSHREDGHNKAVIKDNQIIFIAL